jgi:hypothetical protein
MVHRCWRSTVSNDSSHVSFYRYDFVDTAYLDCVVKYNPNGLYVVGP